MVPCKCGDVIDLTPYTSKPIDEVRVGIGNGTYHSLNECGWVKKTQMITWRNWYNGSPRDYHTTTVAFFERMQTYIKARPKWDVETEVYKRFTKEG